MRLAWFQGDAQEPDEDFAGNRWSQDDLMEFAERRDPIRPVLRVLLVPDDVKLTDLGGDDWNDAPANCNASEPYDPPDGSRWLVLGLGDEWPAARDKATPE